MKGMRPALGSVALGFIAVAVALFLVPATRGDVGPAVLSVSAGTGGGRTSLALPPLGTVFASTHRTPLDVDLAVVEIDFERLGPLATSATGRDELRADVAGDMPARFRRAAIQEGLGAIVVGFAIALLVFQRRWKRIAVSVAVTAGLWLALFALTAVDYDVGGFDEPRYTGTLTKAREVIATVQRNQEVLDQTGSRFEVASQRISDLIGLLAESDEDPRSLGTAILHVSDIHANPLGIQVTRQLAREFAVDAVIDTGDIASAELDTGEISTLATPVDRALKRAVQGLGAPYFLVPGNHDSLQLREELDRADRVEDFEAETELVAGLEVAGWADPTFSTRPIPSEEKDATRLEVAESEVAPFVADAQPDVLAVHDERLASFSYGDVPLILVGHSHERDLREVDGTLVLTVGSTGATGLKSFTVEAARRYEAQILYFDSGRIVAVDYITLEGPGGDFELERHTFR